MNQRNVELFGSNKYLSENNFVNYYTKKVLNSSVGFVVLLNLIACQSLAPQWVNQTNESMTKAFSDVEQASPVGAATLPPEIRQLLLPPLNVALPTAVAKQIKTRFDLSFDDVEAREVFMSLVENTTYSVVLHPMIKGRISMHLKGVTLDEAFDVIRDVHGYDYTRSKNQYIVYGRELQTRIYVVNYLNVVRRGQSETMVRSEYQNNTIDDQQSMATTTTGRSYDDTKGVRVSTQHENNFWQELKDSVTTMIGDQAGRRVVMNAQAGLLVVKAEPAELRLVEKYLDLTQKSITRQVILEAKILDVSLYDSFQAGINWASLIGVGKTNIIPAQVGGGSVFNGNSVTGTAGNSGNLLTDVINGSDASAFGGLFSLAIKNADFSAFIEAIKMQGEVHVLSSPRVSTLNNQKAVIKVGGDEFFITGLRHQKTVLGASTTETPSIDISPFFSGISLDVTPQIDQHGQVILHIHPTISDVTQTTKSFVLADKNYTLPLAMSSIQESDNVVSAASGQVIVIGGLMKEVISDDNASVPLLADLPLIGNFFKQKKSTRIKKELVILLKPTIVDNSARWQTQVNSTKNRFAELRGAIKQ